MFPLPASDDAFASCQQPSDIKTKNPLSRLRKRIFYAPEKSQRFLEPFTCFVFAPDRIRSVKAGVIGVGHAPGAGDLEFVS